MQKKVTHKITACSDEVCAKCAHCIDNVCHAFKLSHSNKEYKQRRDQPAMCRTTSPVYIE